jgi:hypothetical protein
MSAPGRAVGRPWRALVMCLLVLGCVIGAGWSMEHGSSMDSMVGTASSMQHADPTTTADHSGGTEQDVSGHCVDSGQQCHQATFDSGSAAVLTGNLAAMITADNVAAAIDTVPPDLVPPRPPDIHALCVNRI